MKRLRRDRRSRKLRKLRLSRKLSGQLKRLDELSARLLLPGELIGLPTRRDGLIELIQ